MSVKLCSHHHHIDFLLPLHRGVVRSIIQYRLNTKVFKSRNFWTLSGHSQEGESHPKASSPACRLFPVVWATSVGGKVNRNHRPITFDCCQWFLDPIGCQKCNPQVKIQGALNPISHSSIQSSCIIQIFCTSVKPPFYPPIFTMGTQLPIISWSSSGTSCPFMHQKWTRGLM